MTASLLRHLRAADLTATPAPFDGETLAEARAIVKMVRDDGEDALRLLAERFAELEPDQPLVVDRSELIKVRDQIDHKDRAVLERVAERIAVFAEAQRASLQDVQYDIPGGQARQVVNPVDAAGCYAPGGRYPLPSSVLMTAVTARTAGVKRIIVASPKPTDITLAAAAVAGADCVLQIGGAQAIAALAFGVGVDAVDSIAGPGNRWVTAAKYIVSDRVRIDLLAGPSELVIIADANASPALIAADLLAQAEHDVDARPMLIALDEQIIAAVELELHNQIATLAAKDIARAALINGGVLVAATLADAADLCNLLAPEHLQLSMSDPQRIIPHLRHYGALFIGEQSAEVFGDYGAGPNHTLPTGGTARFTGGLSVFHFLKVQTQLQITEPTAAMPMMQDAVRMAEMEGLSGHAAAARRRLHDCTAPAIGPETE